MENVVIIIIDALRPRNLSLFGYAKETDKHLKEIAAEGVLFREHFSVSNSTFPSVTSLFTGLYPSSHGIIHQAPYIKPEEYERVGKIKFWLPEFLQNRGYETIAIDWIGLWFKRGFKHYGDEEKLKYKNPRLKVFLRKILFKLPPIIYKIGKKIKKPKLFASSAESVDLAISRIKEAKKPFFLFMHVEDTHFPFPNIKNPELSGKKDINDILLKIKTESQREYVKKRIIDGSLNSLEDIKNKYDLAIKTTDAEIGRLVNFLKNEGLWNETIFVVLSDHGDSIDEHGIYFSHSGLFDETIHVPLIMKFPKIGKKEIYGLVQNIDIAPTILDYLRMKEKEKIDGKSLMGMIRGNDKGRNKILAFDGLAGDIKCERTKTKKKIVAENPKCNLCKAEHHGRIEEYDLKKDPGETKNIYEGKIARL